MSNVHENSCLYPRAIVVIRASARGRTMRSGCWERWNNHEGRENMRNMRRERRTDHCSHARPTIALCRRPTPEVCVDVVLHKIRPHHVPLAARPAAAHSKVSHVSE